MCFVFAADPKDKSSTFARVLCACGSYALAQISWFCKMKTTITHNRTDTDHHSIGFRRSHRHRCVGHPLPRVTRCEHAHATNKGVSRFVDGIDHVQRMACIFLHVHHFLQEDDEAGYG